MVVQEALETTTRSGLYLSWFTPWARTGRQVGEQERGGGRVRESGRLAGRLWLAGWVRMCKEGGTGGDVCGRVRCSRPGWLAGGHAERLEGGPSP